MGVALSGFETQELKEALVVAQEYCVTLGLTADDSDRFIGMEIKILHALHVQVKQTLQESLDFIVADSSICEFDELKLSSLIFKVVQYHMLKAHNVLIQPIGIFNRMYIRITSNGNKMLVENNEYISYKDLV